jgi:pseudoazurin
MGKYMKSFFLSLAVCFLASSAHAAEIKIEMLNKLGTEMMVFSKKLVHVKAGDTVEWIATSKGHNVNFIKGGVPAGVALFKSKLGENAEFTFKTPGIYAYNCTPHYGMGMIGFVVVDKNVSNLAEVKAINYPGKAKKVAQEILATIK